MSAGNAGPADPFLATCLPGQKSHAFLSIPIHEQKRMRYVENLAACWAFGLRTLAANSPLVLHHTAKVVATDVSILLSGVRRSNMCVSYETVAGHVCMLLATECSLAVALSPHPDRNELLKRSREVLQVLSRVYCCGCTLFVGFYPPTCPRH